MKLLGKYKNGNYNVSIFDDGTKIRHTMDDVFHAEFPENIDIKITNQCDLMCKYCHENSTPKGMHGVLSADFLDSLLPYTELAIGGGNPLAHPDIIEFCKKLKERNIIPNLTVNQTHLMSDQYFNILKELIEKKYIYGIGVSFKRYTPAFVERVKSIPNVVLHVINGVTPYNEIEKLFDQDLKMLILGYKEFRRGEKYYTMLSDSVESAKKLMYNNLEEVLKHFKVVSFDNLALLQLDTKRLLSQEKWDEFYMGDDGQHTMYIDMVDQKFALNSTSPVRFDLLKNIRDMFSVVKTGGLAHA